MPVSIAPDIPKTHIPTQIPLPTGLPIGDVNAYLFLEPEPVLLDTGINSTDSLVALRRALNHYGLTFADLSKVIISHPHVDHFGLSGAIAAESRATFHIFEPAVPWLADYPHPWATRLHYYVRTLFKQLNLPTDIVDPILTYYQSIQSAGSAVPAERVFPLRANQQVQMGPLSWRILHTPGHTSTLTCFYQPETRQFLSTDMLLRQTPTPIVEQPLPGAPRVPCLPQFIQSLQTVRQLNIDIVYPGHGRPFTDHRALIAAQLKRITHRKEECLALIKAGHTEVAPMLLTMYPQYPPPFRFAALWMLIGYLDLLKQEGRILEETTRGVLRYRPA